MSEIFSDGFESGDFSNWDGETGGGTVTVGSKLNGVYGWSTPDGYDFVYKSVSIANGSTIRLRFYFNLNDMANFDAGEGFYGVQVRLSGGVSTYFSLRVREQLGNITIRPYAYDDDGTAHGGTYTTITVGTTYYVEFKIVPETADGNVDGTMDWWLNGVHQEQVTGLDNYNLAQTFDLVRLGETSSRSVGITGTAYWDDFVIRDDGTEIGPVSSGNIAEVQGVAWASVAEVSEVAKASISEISEVAL